MDTTTRSIRNPSTVGEAFEMRTIMRFSWLALLVVGLAAPATLAGKASEAAKPQDGVMHV